MLGAVLGIIGLVIVALDKQVLTDRVRKIPRRRLDLILAGIDTVLGR